MSDYDRSNQWQICLCVSKISSLSFVLPFSILWFFTSGHNNLVIDIFAVYTAILSTMLLSTSLFSIRSSWKVVPHSKILLQAPTKSRFTICQCLGTSSITWGAFTNAVLKVVFEILSFELAWHIILHIIYVRWIFIIYWILLVKCWCWWRVIGIIAIIIASNWIFSDSDIGIQIMFYGITQIYDYVSATVSRDQNICRI